ncbi:MAG: trehalose-phosphatase [Candidatus Entotheonellia bacterium]
MQSGSPAFTIARRAVDAVLFGLDDVMTQMAKLQTAALNAQGVKVFNSMVELIYSLKARGIKVAIVSSGKNYAAVLEAIGLSDLFDIRVDGRDIECFELKGKPAPDIFLKAAEQLGVPPERTVIVEDSIAGVEAGRNGRFAVVIGVAMQGNQSTLQAHGADVVVADLREIGIDGDNAAASKNTLALPSALELADDLIKRMHHKRIVIFLDYDGTLTSIVERPDQARLSMDMRQTIGDLARCCPVAIISGRDRADLQRLIQLDDIFYAGSHGFDITGPLDRQIAYEQGADFLPSLTHAERELWQKLARVEGVFVERKKFSIAVHVRSVACDDERVVEASVDDVLARHPDLRKGYGKKVFELQPRLDWHKGKAVLWLLQALELDGPDAIPLYIGDDLTDEDAFRTLADRGIGIVVEEGARLTAASYVLKDPEEVQSFLRHLLAWLAPSPGFAG